MKNQANIYELIDLHLQGKLEGEDLNFFNRELSKDSKLNELIEDQILANSIVKAVYLDDVKHLMKTEYSFENKTFRWKYLGLGVMVLGIVIGGFMFFEKDSLPQDNSKNKIATIEEQKKQGPLATEKNSSTKIQVETNGKKTKSIEFIAPKTVSKHANNNTTPEKKSSANETDAIERIDSVLADTNLLVSDGLEQKTNPKLATINPCKDAKISAYLETKNTCSDKENGTIEVFVDSKPISSVLKYQLINNKKEVVNQSSIIFRELKAENYTVEVYDQNECLLWKKEAFIYTDFTCNDSKSYSFNPNYNEKFVFPELKQETGIITILNKSGLIVFEKSLEKGIKDSWEGKDLNGQQVEIGMYFFTISYENGDTETGEILIY